MRFLLALFFLSCYQFAHADCFDNAAKYQHVSATVLRSIAQAESSNNPKTINRNRNGSVDYGLMQINSIHLRELNERGVHKRDLMNACKNIYIAAYYLRLKINKYGNNYRAVGAYHSETPRERDQYAAKIKKIIIAKKMKEIRPLYASN